ncbi:MAG: 50S ribosomal protein L24 [Candidatus Delongbacteria bacterium]|nr:50S ribosomal protein L24 [Candidatus Delongbacteria bacterium]MBN2836426.1 50S ribosomal protein L24 [Candidatus Delongbacteria bacterium]
MKVVKNDKVRVITGNHAGKEGVVRLVLKEKNKVVVEGVNIAKKHVKPNQFNQTGGIVEKEMPIHVSNVMVVCPSCGKAARIGKKRDEDGSVTRYCKACSKSL